MFGNREHESRELVRLRQVEAEIKLQDARKSLTVEFWPDAHMPSVTFTFKSVEAAERMLDGVHKGIALESECIQIGDERFAQMIRTEAIKTAYLGSPRYASFW